MDDTKNDPEPEVVTPPPIDVAPSATGVVDGDEEELAPARPSEDAGE